jgi:hypothetical protein
MRNGTIVAIFAIVLASAWFIVPRVRQARREAAYQMALAPFQRDLPIGMERDNVKKYLDSHHVEYREIDDAFGGYGGPTYEIKVGEEPANLVCGPGDVYVALDFGAPGSLKEVHIRKQLGRCL